MVSHYLISDFTLDSGAQMAKQVVSISEIIKMFLYPGVTDHIFSQLVPGPVLR